jgi:flagellar motor switch protein FliG
MSVPARTRAQTPLTGVQKSAVLCLALGPELASQVLRRLSSDEVELVAREMTTLSTVGGDAVDSILREFQERSQGFETTVRGGRDYAHQVLHAALGKDQAQALLDKIQERYVVSDLTRLNNTAPEMLGGVLRGEHPQAIALILAHLGHRQAAGVLQTLEPAVAAEVLYRVARMEKVAPEMLAVVQSVLDSKGDLALGPEMAPSGGPDMAAEMLNLLGGTVERQLLEGIAERDPEMAEQIKSRMFLFEDLILVDGKGMQRLLREIEAKDLALALKGASDELKRHVKASLSGRAGEALEEEIEMLGAVRVKDVEAVHARILEVLRGLGESGEVLVPTRGGSDDVIL